MRRDKPAGWLRIEISVGEGISLPHRTELCAAVRKVSSEALVKGCMGQVLSREIKLLLVADGVKELGRRNRSGRDGEIRLGPTRSQTLCTYTNHLRENREIPWSSEAVVESDRIGKSKDAIR